MKQYDYSLPGYYYITIHLEAGNKPLSDIRQGTALEPPTVRLSALGRIVQQELFQTSFYEAVLRNEQDYQERWRYIEENPAKWLLDPEDI